MPYVIEQTNHDKRPTCSWIKDIKDDVQTRLYDLEGLAGLCAACRVDSLEDVAPNDDDNEYAQASYNAVKDYVDAGNQLPAILVAFPGQTPENTYQVWSDEEDADIANWQDLLDEWAAYSNRYKVGPWYVGDDEIGQKWADYYYGYMIGEVHIEPERAIADAIAKEADLKPFVTRDREAGNVIDEFADLDDAKAAVESYEDEDRKNGDYTENFYEIYNQYTNKIID